MHNTRYDRRCQMFRRQIELRKSSAWGASEVSMTEHGLYQTKVRCEGTTEGPVDKVTDSTIRPGGENNSQH